MNGEHKEEIIRAIGQLEGKISVGFEGVHKRQDIANSRTNKLEERVNKLEITDSGVITELHALKEKQSGVSNEQNKWKDRMILWALTGGGILIYTALVKLGIINL